MPGDVLTLVGQNSYLCSRQRPAGLGKTVVLLLQTIRLFRSGPFALAVLDCRRFMGAPLPLSPNHQIRSYLLMAKTRQPVRTLTVVDNPFARSTARQQLKSIPTPHCASVVMFGGGHARLGRPRQPV